MTAKPLAMGTLFRSLCGCVLLAACSSDSGGAARSDGSGGKTGNGGIGGASAGRTSSSGGAPSAGGTTHSAGGTTPSTPQAGGTSPSTPHAGGATADAGNPPEPDSGGPAPVVCGMVKPGPTNTGVPKGTKLTPSGSITVKQDGQIVEGLDIAGTITVLANDVTIRKVHIKTGDYYPIRYFDNDNTGLVVEDSEIEGTSGNVTSSIAFAHYTARRLDIHGGADGLKADEDVLIEGCYIHDLSNGPGEHNDGVQSTGGKGVTIRGNFISGASNACVQTGDEHAATEDLTVECNWLSGGGYTLNIRGVGATRPRGTRIVNNRFTRDYGYGPWTIDDPSPVVTGNVYDDNDAPIPFP